MQAHPSIADFEQVLSVQGHQIGRHTASATQDGEGFGHGANPSPHFCQYGWPLPWRFRACRGGRDEVRRRSLRIGALPVPMSAGSRRQKSVASALSYFPILLETFHETSPLSCI